MNLSIRWKIILFIISPIVGIYLSVMIFNISKMQQWTTNTVEKRMIELTRNYAKRFNGHLREAAVIAELTAAYLADNPHLPSNNIYEILENNLQLNPLVYGSAAAFEPYQYQPDIKLFVRYVYRDGDILLQADPVSTGYDYTEIKQTYWHIPRSTGKATWTEPYFDEGAGNILMSTYSVPFFRDDKFLGIATVDIPLEPLRELVDLGISKGIKFTVISKTGNYVYSPYIDRINKSIFDIAKYSERADMLDFFQDIIFGKTGMIKISGWTSDDKEWIFYESVESAQWSFIASITEKQALSAVQQQLYRNLYLLIFSMVLIMSILWFISIQVSRPISILSKAVSEISKGNLNVKAGMERNDEIGELAIAFDGMALKLSEREIDLQKYSKRLEEMITDHKGLIKELEININEQKHTEAELRESENKYRILVENLPQKIFLKDKNSVYISCNQNYARDLKINADDIAGKTDFDFYPEELAGKYRLDDKKVLEMSKSIALEEPYIQDGKEYWVYTIKSPVKDKTGNNVAILGIFWDITNQKKAEEELQKAQKIESIGVLAGGIAHDFNNLLAVILNNVYISKMQIDHGSKIYSNLDSVENAIHRAANLTQQLLTFSRGGAPVKKTTSVIELITESAEFALRGSNVNTEYNVSDDLWPVEVDEGQINQVIHNLILNADQAMPNGGTIMINAENYFFHSGNGLPLQKGRYLKIVIQDHGAGIAGEHLQKIFDPYFTTKEMGQGLGLSITYSIIKQHDGHILVESKLGIGTTFTIYLPASLDQPKEDETVDDTFVPGKGRILLMDDEDSVRESIGELLKMRGYDVENAKDGVEAISLYKEMMDTSKRFDAVILDLTIRGGMGGKESMKKLLEIDPNVKVIVSSGYSNDPVMANFREYGFSDVFCKASNSPDELFRILHKVLKR